MAQVGTPVSKCILRWWLPQQSRQLPAICSDHASEFSCQAISSRMMYEVNYTVSSTCSIILIIYGIFKNKSTKHYYQSSRWSLQRSKHAVLYCDSTTARSEEFSRSWVHETWNELTTAHCKLQQLKLHVHNTVKSHTTTHSYTHAIHSSILNLNSELNWALIKKCIWGTLDVFTCWREV